MNEKTIELEDRLINFSVEIIKFIEKVPDGKIGQYLTWQLFRSSTSPALNYGEARSAESRNDFVHKMKICLKELRESYNCLRIINKANITNGIISPDQLISECNELISIFVRSIETANKRK